MKNQKIIISVDNNINLQTSPALQEITNYYLAGRHLPSGFEELRQQMLLVFVSASGASLYAIPADTYAHLHGSRLAGDTLIERQINYIGATCMVSSIFLYNATDIFFTFRRNELIPKQLENYLEPTVGKNIKTAEDFTIVIGAAISAVPLMLVSLAYPPQWLTSLWAKIIFGAIIEFDNTVLHFLPLKLSLQYPIYRFPILPFELLAKKIYARCCEVPTISLQQQIDVKTLAAQHRTDLINYIKYVQTRLLLDKSEWGFFVYHWHFSKNFKQQMTANLSGQNLIQVLAQEFPVNDMIIPKRSMINAGLEEFSGFLGNGWIVGSCAGYLLGPVKQVYALVKNPWYTGLIVGMPEYFFTVLLSFFGYNSGKQLYNLLTQWGKDTPKFPLEFKLYPKTFAVLMYLNAYIAFFPYAAAVQLVIDNFNEGILAQMQGTFIILAITGLSCLGLTGMEKFSEILLRRYAIYFGGEMSRLVARLMTALEQLESALRMTKDEVFASNETTVFIENLKKGHTLFESKMESTINSDRDSPDEFTPLRINHHKTQGWGEWLTAKCNFWNSKSSLGGTDMAAAEISHKGRCVIS